MIKLIPQPKQIKILSNEKIKLNFISFSGCLLDNEVQSYYLSFFKLPKGDTPNVIFKEDISFKNEEYEIEIDDVITITSSSIGGKIYALEVLKQIFFQLDGCVYKLKLRDYPTKEIRGFMLDVGRYFFPVSDVKAIIERMASHKLNLLHFHLTEDQGWRIEIEKYPLLTEIGSIRYKTNFTPKKEEGYYTKKDIKEIVNYAKAFGIDVMPEYDIPGHSRSAIAAYNKLTCFPRKLKVADHWGVKHDVLCVSKEETITFVKDIIDEMCQLFPYKYFHIGGDEVPKHRWNLCPSCKSKIKELGLNNADELQFWFMNEIKNYLNEKGKEAYMWSWELDDISTLDDDIGFTRCSSIDIKNRPYIDTSTQAYYIDLPYGYISLEQSANHKGFDGNCIGVEATLWTEYVPDMKKADYMTFPRLSALSEAGWNGYTSYDKISDKLDFYYSYLDKCGYGYADIKTANPSKLKGKLQVLWFERRQLAWEGLTNLIVDKKIELFGKKYL